MTDRSLYMVEPSRRKSIAAGLVLCAVVLCASSCAVFRPSDASLHEAGRLPEAYLPPAAGVTNRVDAWWTAFGDPTLNRLLGQALAGNLTLRQAEARLRQARAIAAKQGAAILPEIGLEASAGVRREQADTGATTRESYGLGLAGSYELDLWGRVRATRNAAALDAEASRSERDTAAMTLAAEVALRYFDLLAQREGLELLRQQVAGNHEALDLLTFRYGRARATMLDVLQQRAVVAATEALIPSEAAREQTLRHELAVLLGLPPQAPLAIDRAALPGLPPLPDAGVPSDLLTRRPDVQAAEARLRAAGWQTRAARADRLPALRLTASASYGSDDVATLFDNWAANLAAGLAAPLVDGGRRRAEVQRTRALQDERMAAYRATILNALREVQNALVEEYRQSQTLEALARQLEASNQSYAESLRRYAQGLETYLPVITAQLSSQSLKRALIKAHTQQLAYRVALCRALGGDWQSIVEQQSPSAPLKENENHADNRE